jgi:ABC-type Zn uptake system ZnuABC Zn-binding protein ZnuA
VKARPAATATRLARTGPALLLAALLSLVAACSTGSGGSGPTGATINPTGTTGIRVAATTTVLADLVRQVGGDRLTVDALVPAGVGPEDYEPRPEDARRLADAQLIVKNGLGLDDFLDRLVAANAAATPILTLSDGVAPISVGGRPNPHLWLDPTIVRDTYVPALATRLSALDPAGAATYAANAMTYEQTLSALDRDLLAVRDTIPAANRRLVTSHDAFPYFARHFGFELIGVILPSPGQEPTASDLAALVERVKSAGVRAVFSEAQFSPKLAQTLASEAGVTTVVSTLYTDALGPAPADTYVGLMRSDMDQIAGPLR